jgi:predicted small lipoprotein YifL
LNFKLILLITLFLLGCGVEGPPVPPAQTTLPLPFEKILKDKETPKEEEKENNSNRDQE